MDRQKKNFFFDTFLPNIFCCWVFLQDQKETVLKEMEEERMFEMKWNFFFQGLGEKFIQFFFVLVNVEALTINEKRGKSAMPFGGGE